MYCRKCGQRIPAKLDHCPSCGTELSGAARSQQNPANRQLNSDQYRTAPAQDTNQPPQPYAASARDSFQQPASNAAPPQANAASPQTSAAPSQDPPQSKASGTGSWGLGAKIWFVLAILVDWSLFIFLISMPETATNPDLQQLLLPLGIVSAGKAALYVWIYLSKNKVALELLLCLSTILALKALADGNIVTAAAYITPPAITWLVAHKTVSE